jgi:hypothetical protein
MHVEQKFIDHDFKLPSHRNELSKADDVIEKLRQKFRILECRNAISDKEHLLMFEEVVRVLDYVGRLSMPVFAVEDEMERLYIMRYPHSPELAKKLWLDHYEDIHHPYNLLKNRCFKLIEELDELYIKVNNSKPKNWKE